MNRSAGPARTTPRNAHWHSPEPDGERAGFSLTPSISRFGRARHNGLRISCSLWRPQTRTIVSASSGRHGLSASCAG